MKTLVATKGIALPDDFVEKTIERMRALPDGSTSSMHQDFRRGLPLELESLQFMSRSDEIDKLSNHMQKSSQICLYQMT